MIGNCKLQPKQRKQDFIHTVFFEILKQKFKFFHDTAFGKSKFTSECPSIDLSSGTLQLAIFTPSTGLER